jgi:hypothetical protein
MGVPATRRLSLACITQSSAAAAAAIPVSGLYAALLQGTGVRPKECTSAARASKAGAAAEAGQTTLMSSKYAAICASGCAAAVC